MPPTSSQRTKPPALQPGDTVGIVAPASPIQRNLLDAGCVSLWRLGYCEYQLGRLNDARVHVEAALAISPHDEFARQLAAELRRIR